MEDTPGSKIVFVPQYLHRLLECPILHHIELMNLLSVGFPLLLLPLTTGLDRGIVRLHSGNCRSLSFVVLQFSIHSRSMQNDSREAEKWMYVEASKIIAMRKALVVLLQPLPSQKGLCHAQIKPITVAEKVQKWPLANENGESRDNAGNSK